MPPDMAVSMRHSKLKASEAALLAGEVKKPTWESRNEGIHERVSFEDTIWGFDLAGGSFYKTPLRVTHVKEDSRAAKAGIRPGDKIKRINDIDTSTLTIQEAHEIILESGIHLRIAVTAPEDEEDAYFCYEDPLDTGYDSEEERRKEEEMVKKRQVHAKVSSYWSLQWPWVSKRRVIYRESNCFMVPSKYETNHKEKFPPVPFLRTSDEVVFDTMKNKKENLKNSTEEKKADDGLNQVPNGVKNSAEAEKVDARSNGEAKVEEKLIPNNKDEKAKTDESALNGYIKHEEQSLKNDTADEKTIDNIDEHAKGLENILEIDEDHIPLTPEPLEDSFQEISEATSVDVTEDTEDAVETKPHEADDEVESRNDVVTPEPQEESIQEISEASSVDVTEDADSPVETQPQELEGEVESRNVEPKDDDVIHELLKGDEVSDLEEEHILDSILSDSQETDTVDER